MAQERFEKIWIDLREFGWGIRQVPVIWPDDKETLGPDTVGSVELKDDGVQEEDLAPEVREKLNKPVDPEQLETAVTEAVNTAVPEAVSEAVQTASEEDIRDIVKDWQPEEEPEQGE